MIDSVNRTSFTSRKEGWREMLKQSGVPLPTLFFSCSRGAREHDAVFHITWRRKTQRGCGDLASCIDCITWRNPQIITRRFECITAQGSSSLSSHCTLELLSRRIIDRATDNFHARTVVKEGSKGSAPHIRMLIGLLEVQQAR